MVWSRYFPSQEDAIQATGTIEATSVQLSAKQYGTIETMTVKAGDLVEKGQVVAQLSRNDLLAQREQNRLSVLKAEAALADLTSGARSQEIQVAQANVNIAQENLARATDDYNRIDALFKTGAVSQVEHERARTAMEVSKNQLQYALSQFSLLEAGSRPEAIEAAKKEVERNRAVLKTTESLLEDLKIISPIKGVILTKNYEVGEFVQAGAPVATVVNMEDLWIKVYVPTDDLPSVRLGQTVSFTVSGVNKTFEGKVEEIATKGEFTPKTIQTKKERTNVVFGVKIRISSEGGTLKPGMPADVIIKRGQ
ncbi:secretion protein HlyD [Clostridiales bacterium PH28_bin88]|nr:secretion protein HlyD [Clostridiales bacterium PH28_bin88]